MTTYVGDNVVDRRKLERFPTARLTQLINALEAAGLGLSDAAKIAGFELGIRQLAIPRPRPATQVD